jgi:ATP-dependent helicase IRC3
VAKGIDGKTAPHVREEILADFGQQKFPVLVNCGIITEGVDIPAIDCLILARPTKSGVLLQQMIGRGMRLHPGKQVCHVFDLVDSMERDFTRATVPTLYGLKSTFTSTGQNIRQLAAKAIEEEKDLEKQRNDLKLKLTLKPYLDPFGRLAIKDDAIFIKRYTGLAWVRVASERWILCTSTKGKYFEIKKTDRLYQGNFVEQWNKKSSECLN